jgi:hypothetical protein
VAGKLVFTDQPCGGEKVTLGEINSMATEEQPFEYEPFYWYIALHCIR